MLALVRGHAATGADAPTRAMSAMPAHTQGLRLLSLLPQSLVAHVGAGVPGMGGCVGAIELTAAARKHGTCARCAGAVRTDLSVRARGAVWRGDVSQVLLCLATEVQEEAEAERAAVEALGDGGLSAALTGARRGERTSVAAARVHDSGNVSFAEQKDGVPRLPHDGG